MVNTTSLWFAIGFIIIGLLFGVLGYPYITNPTIKEVYFESDAPMLLVEFISWAENIDDNSEVLFDYYVYNFGNTEAKNVKIICEITNSNDVIIKEEIFNVGNIASNSYEYQQSSMAYIDNFIDEMGLCYINSADGDYINLEERLNE